MGNGEIGFEQKNKPIFITPFHKFTKNQPSSNYALHRHHSIHQNHSHHKTDASPSSSATKPTTATTKPTRNPCRTPSPSSSATNPTTATTKPTRNPCRTSSPSPSAINPTTATTKPLPPPISLLLQVVSFRRYGIKGSLHLVVFWILFENVMSLLRTKAAIIGLLEASRVNEWVVTEKLGAMAKQKNSLSRPVKKPRSQILERIHFWELGMGMYLTYCQYMI